MNMSLSNLALLLLPLLPLTVANTPLSDAFVQTAMRTAHGFELAWASRPFVFLPLFSQLANTPMQDVALRPPFRGQAMLPICRTDQRQAARHQP